MSNYLPFGNDTVTVLHRVSGESWTPCVVLGASWDQQSAYSITSGDAVHTETTVCRIPAGNIVPEPGDVIVLGTCTESAENDIELAKLLISIHAPLAGSDPTAHEALSKAERISIHAPLAGSDQCSGGCNGRRTDFNPRSPCGERRTRTARRSSSWRFQSTLPLRGATHAFLSVPAKHIKFQSTLPLRGAT